ncbi:hypothetical protein MSIMFB_02209 [Mycobacterium simulans]|uniref:Uncharacterized protein n=1 Tax=Mycobacterium simulans TaxID=627089 RepID=A0A7Z7IL65_9MYCO|nr:hypothetical protein MSIMFB_02209 [Mycobacterium simulans]
MYALGRSGRRGQRNARRRRGATGLAADRLCEKCPRTAFRGHHLPRGAVQVRAEQDSRRGRPTVSIHGQRLSRLLARLPLLLRPSHPRIPGLQSRPRLRHPDRRQDQCRGSIAPRAAAPLLAARNRGAGHQHRSLPTRRGPLRTDAGHHRSPRRIRYIVLHPDQGHPAAPRPATHRRCGPTGLGIGGGVAGGRRPASAPGRRTRHADTAGAFRTDQGDPQRRP